MQPERPWSPPRPPSSPRLTPLLRLGPVGPGRRTRRSRTCRWPAPASTPGERLDLARRRDDTVRRGRATRRRRPARRRRCTRAGPARGRARLHRHGRCGDDGAAARPRTRAVTALAVRRPPEPARPSQRVRFRGRGFTGAGADLRPLRPPRGAAPDGPARRRRPSGACGTLLASRRPQFPFTPAEGIWRSRSTSTPTLTDGRARWSTCRSTSGDDRRRRPQRSVSSPSVGVDQHAVAGGEAPLEDPARERVDQVPLDDALERAGPVGRVVAEVAEQRRARRRSARPRRRARRRAPISCATCRSTIAPICSRRQRRELDDVVEAVDELRLEEALRAGAAARDVRGHDQHGVLEVDRAALAVGEAAVVEHLEQDVEHVGVRLLDLVEQDDRVRPAAHRLGELAALVVADVAGRRADEPRRRRASPCTRTCRCGPSRCSSSNMNSASARASSVLPTPVGPRNRNVPIGRSGSLSPARERRSALATASTASSWPMTRSCSRSSMWMSFCISDSSRRETGMPVQRADDLGDLVGVDACRTGRRWARRLGLVGSASASLRSSSGISPWRSSAARA